MINRIELIEPVRIQLRENGEHEVDTDWWHKEGESEQQGEERRQTWESYLRVPNGSIIKSIALDDPITICEAMPYGSVLGDFYVRSIERDSLAYLITYGRLGHPDLRILLAGALVQDVHEG